MSTISSIPRPSVSKSSGTVAAAKKADKQNKIKIAAAAVLLLLLVGAGYAFWPTKLPQPGTPDALKFAATDKFRDLSADQKKPYLDAFEKMSWPDRMKAVQAIPEGDREKVFANTMGDRMGRELEEYAKKTPADKMKFLDERIDREEKWAANAPKDQGQGGRGGGRGMGDPGRMKARMENMNPARRMQMAQMIGDMAKRRAERGLPPSNRGGGGR